VKLRNIVGATEYGTKAGNADGYYAHFVEFGRYRRPFMRPAADATRGQVAAAIQDAAAKLISKHTK
jgi:hypothetical protein